MNRQFDLQQLLAPLAACGKIRKFLRLDFQLLAVRLSTSCTLNVLAGKPQKHGIFTSCDGLRVLAAQELRVPLLARALFLGCTVGTLNIYSTFTH